MRMDLIQVLDWFVALVGKLFVLLDSFEIVSGVSLLSFSIATILLVIIIGAIVMRV